MKRQLRQIYDDLIGGRLSREEALDRIRTITLQEQGEGVGVLLATPVWKSSALEAREASGEVEYTEHHAVLCDLSNFDAGRLESLLPLGRALSLQAGNDVNIAQRYSDYALACFERIRTILRSKPAGRVLVQIVIAGRHEQTLLEGLSGLLRTAALENPRLAGQLIIVPAEATVEELVGRLEAEKTRTPEPRVRYEDGVRQVLRWQELSREGEAPPAFHDDAVYLITGGLGGLGTLFAKEIIEQTGNARVVLTGRSPLRAETQPILDGLSAEAGRVSYRQVNLGDPGQVEQLMNAIGEEYGTLSGILHSAGMLADQFILRKSNAQFLEVLAPKVGGTFNLDQASRDVALDFFVLFSSIVGSMGNPAQADYAVANGFLDQFAAYRNRQVATGQRHGRTRSIVWPLWQAGGMTADPASRELLQESTGIQPMQTATGLAAFHRSLALPYDQVLVAEGDRARMRSVLFAAQPVPAEPVPAFVASGKEAEIDPASLVEKTEDYLRRECAELLKLQFHRVDPQAALERYGIDSILAMKLTSQLEKTFGPLAKTLFFEYQTIRELTKYFIDAHAVRLATLFHRTNDVESLPPAKAAVLPEGMPASAAKRSTRRFSGSRSAVPSPPLEDDPIAMIGLSGRYPEAIDLDAYWANLRDGRDCIVEVPKERWDWRDYFSEDRTEGGRHYSKWGGFIAGVDEFDPLFFNISPKEAKLIDPQERLFLQHAWMAIEDAGYTRASLQTPNGDDLPGQVGVYVGLMYNEYQLFGAEASMRGKRLGIPNSAASIANRVSYVLNLHGPSMTLDTMCSSSLTAIHIACQDLRLGRTSLAIAGGVNVSIHPNKYLLLSAGQFISGEGHCQSFGEGGDGYIPGEGVGVVVLKRLSEAKRDGDHIYGVIRGSALTHGGKTNGYTVPNPQAQASAISRALTESQTDARHISYIEAHGTGTKLGDPIEIAALNRAFQPYTRDTAFCPIGSAKSNIGHCESAAGIAGLTKVLLQMQHQQLVPSLHSAELNPHIDFDCSPFVVNQSLRPWEAPVVDGRTLPRIAGISSFGAGGSNAHLIVEEYQAPVRHPMAGTVVILLSARTAGQLQQRARDLLRFVRPRISTLDLASMAYTLQVGREAMDERLGFVVSSVEQLVEKIEAFLSGDPAIEDAYQGQVKRNQESLSVFSTDADLQQTVDKWIASRKLSKLADLWVKGLSLDWSKLHGEATPPRMSLPTYPFARERYWIDVESGAQVHAKGTATAVLHPLLHSNTSDLGQQSYSSTFRGDEGFLENGILPAAAQLEMARVAVQHADPASRHSTVELCDVIFGEPIAVTGTTQVSIALAANGDGRIDFEIYSVAGDQEVVYCQGHVVLSDAATPSVEELALAAPARREIAFVPNSPAFTAPVERKKPAAISLAAPGALVSAAASSDHTVRQPAAGRPPIALSNVALGVSLPRTGAVSSVRLRDDGRGVFSIEIATPVTVSDTIAHVRQALEAVRQELSVKVLLVSGLDHALPGGREAYDEAVEQQLFKALASFPSPTIAVLHGDVNGAGFIAAALCDFMVCNEDATFGYTDAHFYPTTPVAMLFDERFGSVRAQDFLYGSAAAVSGRALLAKGWTCPILPGSEVETFAQTLASTLATKSLDALHLLKQNLSRHLVVLVDALTPIEAATEEAVDAIAPIVATPSERIRLDVPVENVIVVKFSMADAKELVADLDEVFTAIRQAGGYKAVVLASDDGGSLPDVSGDAVPALQRLIVESAIPVVAALGGDARGNAWLIAQACDACVYCRSGVYSAAGAQDLRAAAVLFAHRLGSEAAKQILLTGVDYSGDDLQRRVGTVTVAEHGGVLAAALQIAESWARLPRTSSAAWKRHTATTLREKTRNFPVVSQHDEIADVPSAPALIPPRSNVVTATALPGGIVMVKMEDRDAKNMFSKEFVEGLREVFAHIEQTPAYKVVVLTGYDSYFASGGTKEALLAIQEGKIKFTDFKIFQLPLDCRLPVIAAMQGHGLGAGWTLGLFADLVLLSEESRYVSPYMNYGFTPGAGATWILADKMGQDLARESLLTAQQYTGSELHKRGLRLPILPRADVLPAAMRFAEQMVRSSRDRLIGLKHLLTENVHEALDETYRLELAMHEKTFVGHSDTLAQIQDRFRPGAGAAAPLPQPEVALRSVNTEVLPAVGAKLRTLLANELQMQESDIDENVQFVDLGLDSIGGVAWVRKINEAYQTSLEATKIYSYPTLAQLSRHVKEEAVKHGTLTSEPAPPPVIEPVASAKSASPQRTIAAGPAAGKLTSWRGRTATRFAASAPAADRSQAIAVIGIAGQFPQAKNLDEFWQNIAEGKNCISQVPAGRWDVNAFYQAGDPASGKTNSQWLGALEEYDRFDPLFFNISPAEAESMDPQQRLFLQACWHSIENAGYSARSLSGSRCGVFVGCAYGDYHLLSREQQLSAQGFTGDATSILAGRVSYLLNLQGPCVSVDTACSSSLVAIAQACDSLTLGVSDLALAGGVYVMAGPEMHIKTSQVGMLSVEGKCFTFDQRADGFVPGEGVGVVLLKRLADAEKDHDIIHAVIQGWGVNQDGRTNGITAPNPESQTRLEQEVYDKYRIDPAGIQLIEAHGTGTKLGDPIEVEGLKNAFKKYTRKQAFCAIGSVKSNIGHCLTAAGISGVLKLVLALKHKQLPPTINFERLNEHIDLEDSPFYVNSRLQEWEPKGTAPRQSAISSFGFSGTNAHMVIGEYLPPAGGRRHVSVLAGDTTVIIPLSARTEIGLEQKARDLLAFLRREASIDLVEMAYTLQAGREPMEERLGFLVSSIEQLTEKLEAYARGERRIADVQQGDVKRGKAGLTFLSQDDDLRKTVVDRWTAERKHARLLELWVNGLDLDWSRLYGDVKPQRVSLPEYPFAKERYWIDAAASHAAAGAPATAVLHPLLHSNTSDLSQQRYRSTFTGEEFFLTDHQVTANGLAGRKVLPAVAYLEMARAAIEQASPEGLESTVIELHNTVWVQPIVVSEAREVSIALLPDQDGEVDFEIYSEEGDQQVVHAQGRAVLSAEPAPARLDLEQLDKEMGDGRLEPDSVYAAWARMGLLYGPAFQSVTRVQQGTGQVLARLRLPELLAATSADYVLHPSLADGALQACAGLLDDSSKQPRLPFALERLRILAPCTREMAVWARYAPGSHAGDAVVKLDIDLADQDGSVCVQMHGLSARALSGEVRTAPPQVLASGSLLAFPVWEASDLARSGMTGVGYTEHHVVLCELPRADAETLASLLPHARVLPLHAEPQTAIAQRFTDHAAACFERVQAILLRKPQGSLLVRIIVPDHQEQALLAGLSGLLKTAALENPRFSGQLILVPPDATAGTLAKLLDAEKSRSLDPLVRHESGVRQVLRWREVETGAQTPTVVFNESGVYLITGGLGALGLLFAREILEQTRQAQVILTGRSAISAEKQALLDGLSAQHPRATYRQVDVADLRQVERLIAAIEYEHGRLDGILHVAGMQADNFIWKKEVSEFRDVLAPKVTGTWNLDYASRELELDFFVLFSSLAGALGNLGQADYAAANAFMDQFAAFRNRQVAAGQRQGRTRSIDWPLWEAGAMAIGPDRQELLRQSLGVQPMPSATGIEAFHRSLALPHDQLLVMQGDLAQMRAALLGNSAIPAEPAVQPPVVAAVPAGLSEKTQDYLRNQLAGLLKLAAHKIDPRAALEKYGIDSILALKLTNQLEKTFGSLSKTLFFEYQTIAELTEYFVQSHAARLAALFATAETNDRPTPAVMRADVRPATEAKRVPNRRFSRPETAAPRLTTEAEPIAIVGLSGRYPEALDVNAYWDNLRDGKDCIVEVPKDRWDWREYFSEDRTETGRHFSKWGGFIDGVAEFDPLFFNISPKEAKSIDPQERLFLQHAWMAIEDAGYTRAGLQVASGNDLAGQVGVYAGVMYSEYQLFGAEASAQGNRMGVAGSAASIANRVSYALNLHGPSMTLDTMCSSSLAAIHLACQDLRHGRTSLAIAGGVNVTIHPNKYLVLSAGQFISSDGACQSFGEGGDGYVPGEGVGVVVLKRLSEAKREGDHIYGIIRGSALTHGGRTNGYSVPNPQAQASAISRALAESQIDARHVSYIEAHGTGTKLGDPIEIAALSKAFHPFTQDTGFCLIGSAKSNIGHCESAAGIAGLTKVLLQMQHRQIVPSLHSAKLNPHIDFETTPFVVNQSLRPWEPPVIDGRTLPRIAGISSFGAGGSNAHMIVEEYQAPATRPIADETVIILLSARTAEQLRQKAHDLLEFVRIRANTLDLTAMAYTLQVGREPMEERLGFIVRSLPRLTEKLEAFVAGEPAIEDAYQGQVKRSNESLSAFSTDADLQQLLDKWITNRKWSKLVDLWVKGLDLDWSKLYGETRPPRISLPAYPFAKERFWIDTAPAGHVVVRGAAAVHPLLHRNTSDPSEQRYTSIFTGEELFIAGHQIGGDSGTGGKLLPAAVYLEMARAAVEQAFPAWRESAVLELRDTVWAEPIVVGDAKEVSIALVPNGDARIDYEIYTRELGQDVVHCQGYAVLSREPALDRLDLEQIRRQTGHGQMLAQLGQLESVTETSRDYALHPGVMEGALQAGLGLIGGSSETSGEPRLPRALETLRIISNCSTRMLAWVRYTPGSVVELDIDLCDEQGNVAVQMQGLSWQPASLIAGPILDRVALPAALPGPIIAAPARREIAFSYAQAATVPPSGERKKPAISLAAPIALVSAASGQPSAGRPSISLSSVPPGGPQQSGPGQGLSPVHLYDCGDGIFTIEIAASRTKEMIAHVLQALQRVQQEASVKVLMLSGIEHCFGCGERVYYNEAVERKLFQSLVSFPSPVIAVLQGDVIGAGLMAAALCDFMVCNEDAQYGYTDAECHFYPTNAEAILFGERFGALRTHDLLYLSAATTGRELRAKGWTCPVLPWPQVEAYAQRLASALAAKSHDALRLLKANLARHLVSLVEALTPVEAAKPAPVESTGRVATIELKDLTADLGRVFARLHEAGGYKAIVLTGEDRDFLPAVAGDLVMELRRLIIESPIPVVAALTGNASGNAWLVAQFCDAVVYSQTGVYSTVNLGPGHAQTAAAVFAYRFGNEAAREILLTGADYSGVELRKRVGAIGVAEHDLVLPAAMRVAGYWATFPMATLAAWKQHTAAILHAKVRGPLAEKDQEDQTPLLTKAPAIIPLRSSVVTATAHPDGIVVVKLEDRHAKNMFSEAFIEGVNEVFTHIEQTPAYKVVILTGYDSYFATGGTKEGLLAIQEGKAKFTDVKIFQLPLDCRLPVIAAMQGHAIGAGWTLGLFADLVLLSEESHYVSPYMNYGFTPGAGATWVLGDKMGHDLARESLLAGQEYAGSALKERGLTLPILPRAEVEPAAMRFARQIARATRVQLIGLKRQLTEYVREPLEETYCLELAMHAKTFVGRADTLAQIESKFHREPQAAVAPPKPVAETPRRSADLQALPNVTATLRTLLANELQMRESDIDENAQFVDIGLDSISGVTWIRKINDKFGTSVEATKVYSFPTLRQLGRHIAEEAEKQGMLARPEAPAAVAIPMAAVAAPRHSSPPDASAAPRATPALQSRRSRAASPLVASAPALAPAPVPASSQRIAVIGMAGQFPRANDLEQFWQNIAQGRNCITQVPASRWDVNDYYRPGDAVPGKTNSQWFGGLEEYDLFDPLFFNISPIEAESMDPQQRLFLQACWHSIENAGYDARGLSGSRCGVFVGCANSDYHQLSRQHQLSAQGFTGGAMSILAARISYFLNLQGPSIAIDTACSSSPVAIAYACDSLNSGGSDLALAGGVCVMTGPEMHIKTSQAAMLSPEGKCFTFDERADGFVPGEGVGVVLLKRLVDAERDGDIIYGVIEGWGVNQDGRSNGITAPNPESQTRLEQEVYDRYGIDPAGIQLIEAHGTGTKLGDPIEVEGLKNAFSKYTRKTGYCALGSVKSNIGHCLTAAGIAGMIKLLLALKHKQLPPTINFEHLNQHIDLANSPFYVNDRLQDWTVDGGEKRQAALSSFGFSGTNVHMVIGEYLPPAGVPLPAAVFDPDAKSIVPLSARTPAQLKQKARDILDFIRESPSIDLIEIAYTLQVGRAAMEERLAFVVTSVRQLAEKLQAWLDGEQGIEDAYQGQVKRSRESMSILSQDEEIRDLLVDGWVARRTLSKLVDLWVKGLELDWNTLYDGVKPRRVRLPVYPFAKERYWIEAPEGISGSPAAARKRRPLTLSAQVRRRARGLSSRVPSEEIGTIVAPDQAIGSLLATPVWQTSAIELPVGTVEYTEHHIVLCDLMQVDGERFERLMPHGRCLSLHGAEHWSLAQRYSDYAVACFAQIQIMLQRKPRGKVLVQVVVAGDREQLLLAGLSALLKTAALEHPQFTGQLVLVPENTTAEELVGLLDAEKVWALDAVIRHEGGARQVLRWREIPAGADEPPIAFKDGGVYLITGGLGGLGVLFANEILRQTGTRVVLTGRSALSAEKQAVLDGWPTEKGRVSYHQLDLEDADQVEHLIAAIQEEHGRLDGILHAAGMLADNFIWKKSDNEFTDVLAPKVVGTLNLDQASRDVNLDFFVLFSSIAGALGNPGQADYAAANSFMDQFAAYRNRQVADGQRHGRTRSIDWPLWQSGGMALDSASMELLHQTTGIQPMQTATGLQMFYRILSLPYDQTLVLEGNQPKIASFLRRARIFEPSVATEPAAPHRNSMAAAFSLEQLEQQLKSILGTALKMEASMIDIDQPFVEIGLDSFLGAAMVVAVNKKYGTELSHIKLFDYSTIRALALFLEQEIGSMPTEIVPLPIAQPVQSAAPAAGSHSILRKRLRAARATAGRQASRDDKVAIVGMSGKYPKADDLNQFWDNLVHGRNAVGEVPASRWDIHRYYDSDRTRSDKTYSKWLGAIDGVDRFDPLFFRISPREAEYMDPQHRLFLEESYKAFEDAGYCATTLSNTKCGVYLGISTNDYTSLLLRSGAVSAPVTSNSFSIAAARIAYHLNLKGPAVSIDTACSSALVAMHLACQAILSGEIDMALAGGVSLWLTPESYVAMSQAGMFSPSGQCKTFDESADGIVNGDGVGAVVLKRLKDAERDHDFIYGIILGSGINQDGKTNGITAPSVNSQIELERGIYARYGIDPATISYVEAHGTGTRLGDPIELEALSAVFKEKTSKTNYCALGAVKSNIGHTTAAAGAAGVHKVLLSMQHGTLAPTLHVTKENSRFDLANSPFYISQEAHAWNPPPGSPRRAAVSSFGFSGTNAHLVIEEYPSAGQAVLGETGAVIVPLSARTGEQLRQKSRDLLAFLRAAQEPIDLASLAFTLQVGREPMEERLGLVVSSIEQLLEKLGAHVSGEKQIDGVYQGRVEPGNEGMTVIGRDVDMQEAIEKWVARRKLPKLLELWIRGLHFDWNKLHGAVKPWRIPLPTYPFARERYWIVETPFIELPDSQLVSDEDMKAIDDIINEIGDDSIDSEQAVSMLKMLV